MIATRYIRSPEASASLVGDRVVLYHRVSRAALVLNPTGSWIWDQLQTPQTEAALAAGLGARFPSVPAEHIARDVRAFLDELVQHAMVGSS
jgi:hypothetical protein